MENNYDTLVISGGGVQGFLFLGALEYLNERNYLCNLKNYIGTSVGALTCYMLAIGYTPREIIIYICTNRALDKLNDFNLTNMINGEGATSWIYIEEHIQKMTIKKIQKLITLKELYDQFSKKLVCMTYNITRGITEEINYENYPDMPCTIAIRLSCNLPFVFEDFEYLNSYYVDGGITNNFPIDVGEKLGEKVIGLYIDNKKKGFERKEKSTLQYFYELIKININESVEEKIKKVDKKKTKLISIVPENGVTFNFNLKVSEKLNIFSSGYQQIKKMEI